MSAPSFAPGDAVLTPAGHRAIVIEVDKRGEVTVQYSNHDRASFRPQWLKNADVVGAPGGAG